MLDTELRFKDTQAYMDPATGIVYLKSTVKNQKGEYDNAITSMANVRSLEADCYDENMTLSKLVGADVSANKGPSKSNSPRVSKKAKASAPEQSE